MLRKAPDQNLPFAIAQPTDLHAANLAGKVIERPRALILNGF